MKKIYIKPETLAVNFSTEGMIAASAGIVRGHEAVDAETAFSNKKSFWETEEVEEETSGIW